MLVEITWLGRQPAANNSLISLHMMLPKSHITTSIEAYHRLREIARAPQLYSIAHDYFSYSSAPQQQRSASAISEVAQSQLRKVQVLSNLPR